MSAYWAPLATVAEDDVDEYVSVLENTIEERLENMPDHEISFDYGSLGLGYPNERNYAHSLERAVYRNMLDGLDDVETKTDLLRYSREDVQSQGHELQGPLGTFFDILSVPFRSREKLIVQDIFDEAKRDLDEQKLS